MQETIEMQANEVYSLGTGIEIQENEAYGCQRKKTEGTGHPEDEYDYI